MCCQSSCMSGNIFFAKENEKLKQEHTSKPILVPANADIASKIYGLVQRTIKEIYPKYYTEEAVEFFLELHSEESILKDISEGKVYAAVLGDNVIGTGTVSGDHVSRVFVLPDFQGQGIGTLIMDHLEGKIIKDHGAVWLDSSLSAGKFWFGRGYAVKEYREHKLKNNKVLAYTVMCRENFPIDPDEYNAPMQLVRREMELQGINLDTLREIFPKRIYLLADSLYDTMLAKNVGTLTYHVGGEVYVMNDNSQAGFVKGEMCSPGIATQAEDLMAAGARELIHIGFAGGRAGTRIGDVIITDGAFNDTAVAGLYGCKGEIAETSKKLTDSLCREMDLNGISYRRGHHWTTDGGYVETSWRIRYFEEKGALCVEMEGAGLFSAAKFRSCHAAGIYVVSDSGEGEDWELGWGEKILETSINTVIDMIAKKG